MKEPSVRLDLGMGAKRHGRRSGAHDKKHDQHLGEMREFIIWERMKSAVGLRYFGSELLWEKLKSLTLSNLDS